MKESLARFARELDLGPLIYLGAGELNNGGRDRDSVLADIFEAFMGAICHDCGPEYVEKCWILRSISMLRMLITMKLQILKQNCRN
mgnify:CR=1 FL=1